jgi:transcriptional regulator with XRE-family HTH domain
MTGNELLTALETLGWTRAEFAAKTGVHRNTISRWVNGSVNIPIVVAEYLTMAIDVKNAGEKLIKIVNS